MNHKVTAKELKEVILDLGLHDIKMHKEYNYDVPNLIKLYNKYLSSRNKAIIEFEIVNKKLIIVRASSNIKEIMGYSSEELIGKPFSNYSLHYDPETVNKMIDLLQMGEVITKSNTILHKNGEQVFTKGMLYKDKNRYIEFIWKANDEFNL